ncbi:MAG: amidase [Armatimonadetes bacterium]|nr:amidase [Armatimonadota bacterium]
MGIDGNLTRKQFLGIVGTVVAAPKAALATVGPLPEEPGAAIELGDLETTEKVAGIALDEAHRKLALAGVRTNVKNYPGIRDLHMGNAVEPQLVFTPHGRQPKVGTAVSVKASTSRVTARPAKDEDLAYLSVVDLAALVKAKKVSPVELTKLYLSRLEAHGDKLKCVITLTPELAMKQAKQAEREIMSGHYRGLLHGIPYGIKDLFVVKGYRTTWGAEAFKEQVIDHDATVVRKLTEAGAVCLAKLSCGALAYDDVWWGGQTKNPWNPKQGSSGSSAGSACATAAGLVGFSIGTETLGSIISPSNRCRVSGLRPTYGRVSRYGGMVLTWTMDKVGPICRSAEDCAIVLAAIHGSDPLDPAAVDRPYRWNAKVDLSKLKIGFLYGEKEAVTDLGPLKASDVAQNLSRLGAKLQPVKFSSPPEGIWALLVAEAAATFDEVTRTADIDKIGKLWPPEFLAARYMPAVEYINAHRARALMSQKFEQEWGDLDVVVTDHFWDDSFTICNGTGHPQAIIPWGTKGDEARSVSVLGRLYQEPVAAAVAHAIQGTADFHRRRPDPSTW